MENLKNAILVIGGGGKNGSRVVKKLRKLGYHVFSTTRNKAATDEYTRFFDWDEPATYDAALKNIGKVYIVHPDTSVPEAKKQIHELVKSMTGNSVSKAVLLSGTGQESVVKSEEILMNSQLKWTIVRSAWFNQNFSEGHFLHGIQSGEVTFMAGSVKEPFVDLDDLSDVVTECLLNEKHDGKIYEVTGSELLTFEEAVGMIAKKLGRSVKYTFMRKDGYLDLLKQSGVPDWAAEHMVAAFDEILDGRNENIKDGIQKVLGREPEKFIDFVHENGFN